MAQRFDLVIVGSGAAATAAALRMRAAGWTVAVIDRRPFGGTCALRGCDPKKLLVRGVAAVDEARRFAGKGAAGEVQVAWPELSAWKRAYTDPVPAARERLYAEQGIAAMQGSARFTGRNALEVDGEPVSARHVLLASGAEPMPLGIPGEEHVVTSDDFLALETLPRRLVLVGGGYIAAELSHLAARAGAAVTILERGERLLERFDPDLVGWLMTKFRDLGIDTRTQTAVEAVDRRGDEYRVRASTAAGETVAVTADLVVHAAGRAPTLAALEPGNAGIEVEDGRLVLNEYLQSVSNSAVYAAGDAAQKGPPLTPVASHDAEVVCSNLLDGNHERPDYSAVPSVAFTIPPIAAVGLGEAEARAQGLTFRAHCRRAPDWFTARQAAEPVYGFKVLVDERTGAIAGAHLVGPHADEVINLFALAMRHGLTAQALKGTLFAYPTGASSLGHML